MTRWLGFLAFLGIGMAMTGTIQAAPPDKENTLFDRATNLWAYPIEELWSDRPYYWLSEDEILTFKRTGANRLYTYTPVQRNLKTGKETLFGVAQLMETSESFAANTPPALSPDAKKILYMGQTEKYCLADLNGSQIQTWQGKANQGTLVNKLTFVNSRKSVVLEELSVFHPRCNLDNQTSRAIVGGKIYEMGAEKPVRSFQLEIPVSFSVRPIAIEPVGDRVAIVTNLEKAVDPHEVTIRHDPIALQISEYALEDKPRLLRENRFPMPPGLVAQPVVFSPQGDKVAVLVGGPLRDAEGKVRSQRDPETGRLSTRWRQGLWVGDLRKGSFRELGHLTWWAEGEYASYNHLESTPYPGATYKDSILNVRFTPDEKRLSFYQNHTLYTMPIEAP